MIIYPDKSLQGAQKSLEFLQAFMRSLENALDADTLEKQITVRGQETTTRTTIDVALERGRVSVGQLHDYIYANQQR